MNNMTGASQHVYGDRVECMNYDRNYSKTILGGRKLRKKIRQCHIKQTILINIIRL